MKNLFLLSLAAILILAGCTQDSLQTESTKLTSEQRFQAHFDQLESLLASAVENTQNLPTDSRASCNRVPICHNGNSIVVNNSAVPAHLGHGDQLTCCETSCINESAELRNGGPFSWYYNGIDDDCYGIQMYGSVLVAISYSSGTLYTEAYTYEGMTYYWVYTHLHADHSFPCFVEVTQAEYECARDYMLSYIAANSCIPNLCDL